MLGFAPLFEPIVDYAKLPAIFGFVAVAMVLVWPLFSTRRTVLSIQCLGSTAFSAHFLLMGAETAAITSLIALVQVLGSTIVRSHSLLWLIYGVSSTLLVLATIATWDGLPSILAAIGSLLATVARLQQSTARMKAGFLISAPFWVTHNFLVNSLFGLTVDMVSTTSLTFALCRMRFSCTITK
jgi:hypothetical protein